MRRPVKCVQLFQIYRKAVTGVTESLWAETNVAAETSNYLTECVLRTLRMNGYNPLRRHSFSQVNRHGRNQTAGGAGASAAEPCPVFAIGVVVAHGRVGGCPNRRRDSTVLGDQLFA